LTVFILISPLTYFCVVNSVLKLGANYILVLVSRRAGPTQQSLVSKSQQSVRPRVLYPGGSQVLDVGVFSGFLMSRLAIPIHWRLGSLRWKGDCPSLPAGLETQTVW